MIKKILLLMGILLLMPIAAAFEIQSLLGTNFAFNTSTTSATDWESIGTNVFNLSTNTGLLLETSFQATRITGGATKTDFFYRLLLDNLEVINLTQSLEIQESNPLQIIKVIENVSQGQHNITLQHRVSQDMLRTDFITFAIITTQFANGTQLNTQVNNTNFTIIDTTPQAKITIEYNKINNISNLLVIFAGDLTTDSNNVNVELFLLVDNVSSSGIVGGRLENNDDKRNLAYSWVFEDLAAGNHIIELFANNLANNKVVRFNGIIDILEGGNDDVLANVVFKHEPLVTVTSLTFVNISSYQLNISNTSILLLSAQGSVSKSNAGKDNVTLRYCIEGIGCGFEHTLELEGAQDVGNLAFITTSNSPQGETINNITLQAKVSNAFTATLTNFSLHAIEEIPIESIAIQIDNPPFSVQQITPLNNSIVINALVPFVCSAFDDIELQSFELNHNDSGTFQFEGSVAASGLFDQQTINDNIINTHIEWACSATDNASQQTFSLGRFILNINTTRPAFNVSLVSPANNTLVSFLLGNTLDLTYNLTGDNGSCDLLLNDTLAQSQTAFTGFNSFNEPIIENGTIKWQVSCTESVFNDTVVSEFRVVTVEVVPPQADVLQIGVCNTDTGSVLLLWLLPVITIALLITGITSKIPFITLFSGLLFLVTSWYIAACVAIFALILGFFGVLVIVYSVTTGFKT